MQRTATIERNTNETKISVELNLDGTGKYEVSTGIGFLDHMLEQLSRHSLIDIKLTCKGDTRHRRTSSTQYRPVSSSPIRHPTSQSGS